MSASEGTNDGLLESRKRERGLGGEESWREGAGRAEGKERGELEEGVEERGRGLDGEERGRGQVL